MKFLNKLERKFGRFAIPHLIRYVLVLYAVGFILSIVDGYRAGMNMPGIYNTWLALDIDKVLQGQVWRILTCWIQSPDGSSFFFLFFLALYYMIGEALENTFGTFLFNLYYFSGIIFNFLAVVILYIIFKLGFGVGVTFPVTLEFINQAMFLAFAVLFPNLQLLFLGIIPIKAKWFGIGYAIMLAYDILSYVMEGIYAENAAIRYVSFGYVILIVISMLNFLIFFFATRNYRRISFKEIKRRAAFAKSIERAKRETGRANGYTAISRHKCAICGRTEHDDETLEFRFCSKCAGNYEYCSEHIYTHTHVQAAPKDTDKTN